MGCGNCDMLTSEYDYGDEHFNDVENFVEVNGVQPKTTHHSAHEHAFKCLKCDRVIFATFNSYYVWGGNMWNIHE